jgi:hypothetical protein
MPEGTKQRTQEAYGTKGTTIAHAQSITFMLKSIGLTARNLAAVKNGGAKSESVVLLASSTMALRQEHYLTPANSTFELSRNHNNENRRGFDCGRL